MSENPFLDPKCADLQDDALIRQIIEYRHLQRHLERFSEPIVVVTRMQIVEALKELETEARRRNLTSLPGSPCQMVG